MRWKGRVAGGIGTLAVLAVFVAGCTSTSPRGSVITLRPAHSVSASLSPIQSSNRGNEPLLGIDGANAPLAAAPCQVGPPTAWTTRLGQSTLWIGASDQLPSSMPITLPSGRVGVLQQSASASGVAFSILGNGHSVLATVGSVPITSPATQGGISYASADPAHVAFVYSLATDESAQSKWNLYSWAIAGGPLKLIAHNLSGPNGQPFESGWVHPYVTADAIYWIQAAARPADYPDLVDGSELMQYQFATGATRALYTGLAESFVVYHDSVVFTGLPEHSTMVRDANGKPPEVMRAIDLATGQPAATPPGLDAADDHPDFMVTNGDIIVWDDSLGGIKAWRPAWGRTAQIFPNLTQSRPKALASASPSRLRIDGPLVMWEDSGTFVFDLRSDSFVRLNPNHGSYELTGNLLGIWQYSSSTPPTAGQPLVGDQYVLNLNGLPHLPTCKR